MGAQFAAGRMLMHASFVKTTLLAAPVADLQSATPLALDDDPAVPRAQFDLANETTSGIAMKPVRR
jgi:hypothetical protein